MSGLSLTSPGTAPNGPTVADAGERDLVRRVRQRAGAPPPFVPIGIGDDAAVVEPMRGMLDVVTTDVLVEGVHFRRDWTEPRAIGAKAVTVNFSDLAAMGARPRVVTLSLVLPAALPLADFDALIDGVAAECAAAGASLVGGNIARSPGPLVIDVTAIGAANRRRILRRTGGRAGDGLYLTGAVGGAAAGLAILESGAERGALNAESLACVARYEGPVARLRCGRMVAARRAASACMDLSDGLADAVRQIAEASGTGAEIDSTAIPVQPGAASWLARGGADPIDAALTGGEDYELLFAVPPRRRKAFLAAIRHVGNLPVAKVGTLTRDPAITLMRAGVATTLNSGFSHF
ncbi:MAG TPA: thiamine-phosphate kinase [Vicinamibacterales bacterium]|nr:thiamine-phosphate kinase [Vicinamibacterales bacterium]